MTEEELVPWNSYQKRIKFLNQQILPTKKPKKRYDLRNADFVIPRYETIQYGEHSLRCLGPFTLSNLNGKERAGSDIENFYKCIRQKDLEVFVTIYAMNTVGCVTFLEIRLFTFIDYFYRLIR